MIDTIQSPKTIKKSKRVGRGYGTGVGGHTVGRGQKGQKSRSGYKSPRPGFEGGRMPMSRRIPKLKGFSRGYVHARINKIVIGLSTLDEKFENGETVNIDSLIEKGMNLGKSNKLAIKIVANGELNKKIVVENIKVTAAAKEKIEAAGGEIK